MSVKITANTINFFIIVNKISIIGPNVWLSLRMKNTLHHWPVSTILIDMGAFILSSVNADSTLIEFDQAGSSASLRLCQKYQVRFMYITNNQVIKLIILSTVNISTILCLSFANMSSHILLNMYKINISE